MQSEGIGVKGILVRLLVSFLLVYCTFNPEGISFFHWALKPVLDGQLDVAKQSVPVKLLAGLILLGGWAFFVQTARRSIGLKGAVLILAIVGVIVWAMIDWHVFSPTSSRAIGHLVLIGLALVLTLGMSWSHISRRLSGQVDTDDIN